MRLEGSQVLYFLDESGSQVFGYTFTIRHTPFIVLLCTQYGYM